MRARYPQDRADGGRERGQAPAGCAPASVHAADTQRRRAGRREPVPCERAMRIPRTFTFVDLSGFTNYTAAFGDDAAGRILGAFRTLCRETASEQGVRIAKWLGDGCMIVSTEQLYAISFALELENK